MKSTLEILLEKKAAEFEIEAAAQKDKFNKGFFYGKAEQAQQTIAALRNSLTRNHQDMIDALNRYD
jgi:hypothetical protein